MRYSISSARKGCIPEIDFNYPYFVLLILKDNNLAVHVRQEFFIVFCASNFIE